MSETEIEVEQEPGWWDRLVSRMERIPEKKTIGWRIGRFFWIPIRPHFYLANHRGYVSDEQWYLNEFKPLSDDDAKYKPALEYAEKRYAESKEIFASFDKRSEWLFGIAIALAPAIFFLSKELHLNMLLWIPSFGFICLGMLSALRCRLPGDRPTGMAVKSFLEIIEDRPNPTGWMCGSLNCAIKNFERVNSWKSVQLRNSGLNIFFSMVSVLIMTVIFSLGRLFFSPTAQTLQSEFQTVSLVVVESGVERELEVRLGKLTASQNPPVVGQQANQPAVQPVLQQQAVPQKAAGKKSVP
jgi:hypothetical protein